ncbi:hypothetical protein D3C87_1070950 [compost metagenome]|uniref:DUF3299 domain-containing protein n=1 Tax=Cupriavidus campinensis TaxID=151783 RepID=A0ABY3ETI6_9BURK|nr:DUF3299 domain-containing protein [Cupriavidus campinensis]TSP14293.1 DUF3299 domain-containing protein [Cupriavidus campinensis]CAG2144228.1 hypothetical protein LMG19282_02541 [Cupriavidus campinensis]
MKLPSKLRLSAPLLAIAAVVCIVCIAGLVRWLAWPSADQAKSDQRYTVGQTLTPSPAAPAAGSYREIDWQALLPKGWDPMAPFKGLPLQEMEDGDPRAQAALEKARQFWRDAPIETALDGEAVRLPGFVVSLDGEGEAIREFLLVPYFGACIHVPPPPSNQVVHVRAAKPLEGLRTMDTVWISGVMRVERAETMMGDAGYAMHDARLEPYQPAQPAR